MLAGNNGDIVTYTFFSFQLDTPVAEARSRSRSILLEATSNTSGSVFRNSVSLLILPLLGFQELPSYDMNCLPQFVRVYYRSKPPRERRVHHLEVADFYQFYDHGTPCLF